MKHLIEFRVSGNIEIERGGVATRINIEAGVQCPANVRCYVVHTKDAYTEIADLEVEEGFVRALPCYAFMFIDRID